MCSGIMRKRKGRERVCARDGLWEKSSSSNSNHTHLGGKGKADMFGESISHVLKNNAFSDQISCD